MKRKDEEVRASGRELTPPSSLSRLGGARADFVAALGRRIAELTSLVRHLEQDPRSAPARDDLRRRIHALAAGARLLRFGRLAERLCEGEAVLLIAANRGGIAVDEIAALRTLFEQVPALAWDDASPAERATPAEDRAGTAPRRATAPSPSAARARTAPVLDPVHVPLGAVAPGDLTASTTSPQTVLVYGGIHVVEALLFESGAATFEVERTEDGATAIDLARALAPDLIVVDADHDGAHPLCEALLSDPLTDSIPVVATGNWPRPEEAAPFVALGVARALSKPVSPSALQRACAEATAVYGRGEIQRAPLGEVSVDDLGARLAEELRRGLCDATLPSGRDVRFDLGEGSDVLAALWGAVARIRDLVTIQSGGHVRFAPSGPEGALPLAPWVGDAEGERRGGPVRDAGSESSLARTVAVVVDDDPAVTWFVAGVLRAAGVMVHEARDGVRALELAFRVTPDVVISDVIMPGLDGFALCRALKRDPALRDVPVILLSWKEDLLQRVRELGAGADGYLRKEAAAPVILQRVREVTRARRRVEERLAVGGEVRGRLDGLTSRTLLGLVCAVRSDATITVRDTTFLYEIDVRGSRPVRATRTSVEGTFERGTEVVAALLAVGAGRFVVTPATSDVASSELVGTLEEQLLPHLAAARAAQRLLSGSDLVSVERVELEEDRLGAYAAATPEPARTLLRTLAAGASPRAIITSGQASARLVEDVLMDAAARGAVCGVFAANGEDLFASAVVRETDVLRGASPQRAPITLPELDLGPVIYTSTPAPVAIEAALADVSPAPARPARAVASQPLELPTAATPPPVVLTAPPPPPPVAEARPAVGNTVATLGSLVPPPVEPAPQPRAPSRPTISARRLEEKLDETPSHHVRGPSSYAVPDAPTRPPRGKENQDAGTTRSMWALFAVAGIVFAVGARLSRDRELARSPAPPPVAPVATVPDVKTAEPQAPTVPVQPASTEPRSDGESKSDPILPQDGPLRADDKVPQGQGMLEVVAGTSDTIWIDGTHVGNGPIIKRALAPRKEPYEIRVKLRGEDRVRFALVKEGRLTRIRVAPPWSR
jgi:CheY-like chemotaxis protein